MFLETTPKQLTALQIKSWIDGLDSWIENAKANYDSLTNWLGTSVDNPDYSEQDRLEVMAKMGEAMAKAIALIPNIVK